MFRFLLALTASVALPAAAFATDLPTGTWIANVDDTKGDLVIKEVKAGKVTGSLNGTDFTGSLNGKELTFEIGKYRYEARLVSEPGEGGKTKYTLTGTRTESNKVPSRVAIHTVKTGWYAQMTADAPPAPQGEIKAEVRGVLTYDGEMAYVTVKRTGEPEVRVGLFPPEGDKELQKNLTALHGKEVIVTGRLLIGLPLVKSSDRRGVYPKTTDGGSLYLKAPFEIKGAK